MRTVISRAKKRKFRGAHATRVLAMATSPARTFEIKDCSGESPKQARESRALPENHCSNRGQQVDRALRRAMLIVTTRSESAFHLIRLDAREQRHRFADDMSVRQTTPLCIRE